MDRNYNDFIFFEIVYNPNFDENSYRIDKVDKFSGNRIIVNSGHLTLEKAKESLKELKNVYLKMNKKEKKAIDLLTKIQEITLEYSKMVGTMIAK